MADDISIIRYEELPRNADFLQQRISFTFGRRSKAVSGILRVVQTIVKMLLTTPGTDHFSVDTGTILRGLFRRGVSSASSQLLTMDIIVSIQDMERQILDIQASEPVPDDERLKEIQIINVEYLPADSEWRVQISVLSEAGEQVAFDLAPYLKGE